MMKKLMCIILAACMLVALLCGCDGNDAVSGSDVPAVDDAPVVWEQAASDEAYLEMMRNKLNEYIHCMTAISALEKRLAALGDAEKIAADESFAALAEQLYDWCEGAQSYYVDTLINDQAKTVCRQTSELAGATEIYLENLPAMLAGTYTGELSSADYQNSIVDNALAIYELLGE